MNISDSVLRLALSGKTFSQRESSDIVGGRCRLFRLIETGKIRAYKKPADKQNGRWYCDAFDVIANADVKLTNINK